MMLDNFLVRSALAGIAIALAAGPLGCFVVWRRMAYFGDATAHAAILGVALSFAFSLSVFAGVLVAALVMATTVSRLYGGIYAMDTLLGVTAHAALAIGLVAVSFLSGVRMDLMAYLFGDILAVNTTDLAVIWLGAMAVVLILGVRWSALLIATLNSDVATAGGLDPRREQLVLTLALAVLVAVAIKVVGALLITAMLIIPAAAARPVARPTGRPAVKPPVATAPAQASGILPQGTAKEQYDFAFGLLRQANYDNAELALKEFVKRYPKEKLASNARYWLGETYYVRAAYVQAAEVFLEGYQADPKGPKAPDSLLKLGMSLAGLDKKSDACAAFDKVSKDFPDASAGIHNTIARENQKNSCP